MNSDILRTVTGNGLLRTTIAAVLLVITFGTGHAATDLADVPLTNATTGVMQPNIAFVFDDSGSMDEENMPGSNNTNRSNACYKWHKYNTLAYNPARTYTPPIKADGTRFPNSVFTSAIMDGYFALGAKQFNGSSTNSTVDLTTLGSVTTYRATITFPDLGSSRYYASSLKVTLLNGAKLELLDSNKIPSSSGTNNEDTLGQRIRDSINDHADSTGFSATYQNSGNKLTITAPADTIDISKKPELSLVRTSGSSKSVTISNFDDFTVEGLFYATHKTDPGSTACDDDDDYTRIDVASEIAAPGVAAGSAAALTNYANWYSYYRKRAFLAKAGIGEAFAELDQGKFRVGLFFINSVESRSNGTSYHPNNDLKINEFSTEHRADWFDRLYGSRADGNTPLRAALSRMGRMYAGKISGWDPVQYSCQRNYTILSTDGYWNTGAENSGVAYGPYKMNGSTTVGDQDGVSGVTRPELDSSKAASTLADVAYYYYHTDLRPGNCSDPDVCTDNVPPSGTDEKVDDVAQHQHMTTFTVGLGVNGTLTYQDGYKTSTSGDYFNIKQGTADWPNPLSGSDGRKIDDLWHAAVNGRGTYLSAKDPDSLAKGLASALNAIESTTGSGAAAATSSLQPTAGDNAIYIATYRTLKWDGEVSGYTINLTTGAISDDATWQASESLQEEIADAGNSDTRTIYTFDSTADNKLKPFSAGTGGLTNDELAYFDKTKLSQYTDWTDTQKAAATSATLVNYLRGHDRFENQERPDDYGTYHRLYRDREKVLGDIVHAQPVFVRQPSFDFIEDGYAAFKAANASRAPTLYVAANDGMLHAFDMSASGATARQERWAYVPPMVLPELWRLADEDYTNNHRFFLDGPLAVSDAKINGVWKTVLIGAMGKGGRGYYALDITNPGSPKALWNFTADNDNDVGYSYGLPYITKQGNTWVAVVSSGYNNIPEGNKYPDADGKGYLFVLDLSDGTVLKKIGTGEGSIDSPSGLAAINVMVENVRVENKAIGVYGGDLLGNMWRFNLAEETASKVAALGADKPIMVTPVIADVSGKTVLYFGTGLYLGEDHLDDVRTQSIYAIRDDGVTTVDDAMLVEQTLTGSGSTRGVSSNPVNWNSVDKYGWYMDLGDTGERVTLEPTLYFGTLIVASTVPTASECQPGGYSWLYQLDYRTGGVVGSSTIAGWRHTSPIVGVNIIQLGGKTVGYWIKGNAQNPSPEDVLQGDAPATDGLTRVLWREMFE